MRLSMHEYVGVLMSMSHVGAARRAVSVLQSCALTLRHAGTKTSKLVRALTCTCIKEGGGERAPAYVSTPGNPAMQAWDDNCLTRDSKAKMPLPPTILPPGRILPPGGRSGCPRLSRGRLLGRSVLKGSCQAGAERVGVRGEGPRKPLGLQSRVWKG